MTTRSPELEPTVEVGAENAPDDPMTIVIILPTALDLRRGSEIVAYFEKLGRWISTDTVLLDEQDVDILNEALILHPDLLVIDSILLFACFRYALSQSQRDMFERQYQGGLAIIVPPDKIEEIDELFIGL